jgi:hypothetical protein
MCHYHFRGANKLAGEKRLFVILKGDMLSIFSPLFSLYVENGKLILYSPIQKFEFLPDDIIDLVDIDKFPYIVSSALRIRHKNAFYPTFLLIERDPKIVRKFLKDSGFIFNASTTTDSCDSINGWPIFNYLKIGGAYGGIGVVMVIVILIVKYI